MKKLVLILLFITSSIFAQNTFEFLRVDMSPRVAALGGTYSAGTEDGDIIFHNPAGMNFLSGTTASVTYLKHVLDINFFGVSASKEFEGIGRFGAAIKYADYGKFTEADEFGNKGSDYGVRDLALIVGYANQIAESFYYGVNTKFIYSSINSYSSTGIGVDLGFDYFFPKENINIALSVLNIGGQLSSYNNTTEKLPLDVTVGVSKKLERMPLKLYLDFHRLNKENSDFASRLNNFTLGAEFNLSKVVTLRLGYDNQRRKELKIGNYTGLAGFNIGFGLKIKTYNFDYAYSSYGDFGALHRIGISTNF